MANSTYSVLSYWMAEKDMRIVAETDSFGQPLSMVYDRTNK